MTQWKDLLNCRFADLSFLTYFRPWDVGVQTNHRSNRAGKNVKLSGTEDLGPKSFCQVSKPPSPTAPLPLSTKLLGKSPLYF